MKAFRPQLSIILLDSHMEGLTRHHNMYENFGILIMHEMAEELELI